MAEIRSKHVAELEREKLYCLIKIILLRLVLVCFFIRCHQRKIQGPLSDCKKSCPTHIQCGSNMTGTDLYVNKPHKSQSYLNHSRDVGLKYFKTMILLHHTLQEILNGDGLYKLLDLHFVRDI
jgi:hypothetical protein